ncbi:MAG: hypothetical protein QNK31_12490 [Porticoccus sp.]|nr:hypothetical protein [Porticoccus sp.]
MSKIYRNVAACVVRGFLSGCGERLSPEDQVRKYLTTVVAAVEARDVLAVREVVSDNYKDDASRTRQNLLRLVTGYFLRHKNIYLFSQVEEISFPEVGQSRVKILVAMAGSPMTGSEALLDFKADLYEFDLTLQQEGDVWHLTKARWQWAAIDN